ncbi:MAG: dihydrodipicolinate synthase family protein [Oceanibaculum nanhaiense]|uniref:dihydrodipicolinate synthase family protein n=1 Tax=Oceanibaculum nanhaiense TaxID=1909734 RepID=UPI0025A40D13|nr:dihydrodipicolinate synthase family protein [Oceanibaculum nanhaiense]MDM7946935.1 dihydrodipicolinate synthase family protein [Oceanibaculum nanhaiense]
MQVNWRGVFPAVTTQFNADESLNVESTQRTMQRLIDDGVNGFIMLGTVGENCSLRPEEKLTMLRAAKEVAGGKVPILSGVAEFTTTQAADYARAAEKIGIDGLMVLPGMVYNSDARETVQHFRTVARASGLPIMIYNNPMVYRVDLKTESLAQLADEKTIVALKDSSEDVRRLNDVHNILGDRFVLFAGVDDLVIESVLLGAVGWVSGLTNAFPRESVRMMELALAGRYEEALPIYRWLMPSLHLDTFPKLVQYIKLAEQIVGRGSEMVRAPRLVLEGEERARVTRIIEEAVKNRPDLDKLPSVA